MNRIDILLSKYRNHLQMPLRPGLPPSQRLWFAVYPAEDERKLLNRIDAFEIATKDAGHAWVRFDLQGSLTRWLASVDEDERAEWFKTPAAVELYAKSEWKDILTQDFKQAVAEVAAPERTVFAMTGLMELFDFLHVSDLVASLENVLTGYLLVFFPGERAGNTYRFLDARIGWDYLAIPILSEK